MNKPNIIYLHTHDTGRYISPYSYNLPSPNLMDFAKGAVTFTQAYNCGPTCSPSRAGLLTGMCAHSSGMLGLAHRGFSLKDYSRHLCQFLGCNAYQTVLSGIQHEISHDRIDELGYQRILKGPEPKRETDWEDDYSTAEHFMRNDRVNTQAACEFLMETHEKPFFLSMGYFGTHRPFPKIDPKIDPDYVKVPEPLPNTPEIRRDMAEYMTLLEETDRNIGQVLRVLEREGHADNTIVIFTTDHGIAFPYMKCSLKDSGIGVSLIMRIPSLERKSPVCDALVSHLDIFPTLCELCGLEKADWLQGTSLLPLLKGEKKEVREEIFSEVSFHAAYEPKRCIRTKRWKLIEYFDDYDETVGPNTDNGLSKQYLMDYGFVNRKRKSRFALYDLLFDPNEMSNLTGRAEYQETENDLKKRLHSWMKDTDDPLLKGEISRPEGAIVNIKSGIHPEEDIFE